MIIAEMKLPMAEMERMDSTDQGLIIYADKVSKTTPVTPAVSKRTIPSRQKTLPPINQRTTEENNLGTKYDGSENIPDDFNLKKQILQYEGPEVRTTGKSAVVEMIGTERRELPEQASVDNNQDVKSKKIKINFKEDVREGFDEQGSEEGSNDPVVLNSRGGEVFMSREKALTFERLVILCKKI
jgi:hypothetical protein